LLFGEAHRADPLLGGLFLKPAQAIAEPLMLGDHGPNLLEHVDQRVLVTQHDRRQDADVLAHSFLIRAYSSQFGEYALELSAQKLKGYVLGHDKK
jgi:hypothetical protein